mgnify:CR=1 FL=1|tara:strand:- start:49399 stop:49788 length:390 start_codon:yes stop_codon:yes gene_type:complete
MNSLNPQVTKFLDDLKHPLRKEIEELRAIIVQTASHLSENIKWNGHNYSSENGDRITMRIQPPKQVQLIFHRGAKVKEQPKVKILKDESDLLIWKENDSPVTTFKNLKDISSKKLDLTKIVHEWIIATP